MMRHGALIAAVALSGCVETTSVEPPDDPMVEPVLIGPGTTQADWLASRTDAELYPDLTPEGAALARTLEMMSDAQALALFDHGLDAWACRAPVTDATFDTFAVFIGREAAALIGFPERDVAVFGPRLGDDILYRAFGMSGDTVVRYDADNAVTGLVACPE